MSPSAKSVSIHAAKKRRPSRSRAAEAQDPAVDRFRGQHLALERRQIVTARGRADVTVDELESPLAWLARRRGRDGRPLIEQHQLQAGERLRLSGFAEVSAVATHPDHRGRGYAKALISAVMESMASRGDRAFLHVWPDNVSAIAAYTALGFSPRRLMHVAMLRRVMET